mgnify:CR=1 FL=1
MYLLFILTLKSIFSSVIGSQFYKWYQTTKMGIYFQSRVDQFMEYLSEKYDLELMKKQSKFEADYPLMMKKINKLEKNSHPCKEFHEFEVYPELMARLEEIERRLKIKKK